jgi:2,4-dienoyl-CoA reductase-like NADH-dependent reductase (Old Yellow Enzyme family)
MNERSLAMAHLFSPVHFRSVTARNRIVLPPMCQYSASNGLGSEWHVQHLGARAAGGVGIVFTEAIAVEPRGRISAHCLGLWSDEQQAFATRLATVIALGGAVPGVQLNHAGRKASGRRPWEGGTALPPAEGGWVPLGASPVAYGDSFLVPEELDRNGIAALVGQFAAAAARARAAGFKVVQLHGAHGYLLHSFLSPVANRRTDAYGGDLDRRSRLLFEVVEAVRGVWPDELPLFVRLSAVDWMAGGLTLDDTIAVARRLKATGKVDLIDCSSGGIALVGPEIPSLHPGYQVPFADAVRHQAGIATGAVGMITAPEHAEEILANRRADVVSVGRALLADPAWPLRAARRLGAEMPLPSQYLRATLNP